MGSLIASHLVAALVDAVVAGTLEYIAAIGPAAPSAPTLNPQEEEQPAIAQLNLQEVTRAERSPTSTLPRSTLFPLRSLPLDRQQIENLARDYRMPEQPGALVSSAPVTRPLIGGAVHLEMPRLAPNGQFVRPKIFIGLESSQMKSWMRSQGIAAERCMFPMLRARTRLNHENGEFSAALTMHARCTFY